MTGGLVGIRQAKAARPPRRHIGAVGRRREMLPWQNRRSTARRCVLVERRCGRQRTAGGLEVVVEEDVMRMLVLCGCLGDFKVRVRERGRWEVGFAAIYARGC